MNPDPASGNFHIDKRIPVALLFAIVVQTAGAAWWASGQAYALAQAIEDGKRLEARVDRFETQRDDMQVRVIRIEEKLSTQTDTLQKILRSVESRQP